MGARGIGDLATGEPQTLVAMVTSRRCLFRFVRRMGEPGIGDEALHCLKRNDAINRLTGLAVIDREVN